MGVGGGLFWVIRMGGQFLWVGGGRWERLNVCFGCVGIGSIFYG